MNKPSNPFNPNSIVTPALFAGRTQQVIQIIQKLSQVRDGMPASFVLEGDRGIGKTALAKIVMSVAESNNGSLENLKFLTSYYSVEKGQTFETVLQASLNLLTDKMPETVLKRLADRLGDVFKNGKFAVGAFGASVSYESAASATQNEVRTMAIKDRAVSALSNIVSGLKEIRDDTSNNDGVFIVLDEIHNLSDVQGAAQILRSISTTLDVNRLGNVSFLIIGYPDGIRSFFEGDPSARRHFDVIKLSVMPREEAQQILMKGFDKISLKYDKLSLEKNIDVAGGYPHSIQIIGHCLVGMDTDNDIEADDWEKALNEAAIQMTNKEFSSMYDFRGKGTLREDILNVLALAGKPLFKQQIKEYTGGKNIYTNTCLPQLKRSGAIKELPDESIILHSMLFRSAILIHLYTHAKTNANYKQLIEKFSEQNTLEAER